MDVYVLTAPNGKSGLIESSPPDDYGFGSGHLSFKSQDGISDPSNVITRRPTLGASVTGIDIEHMTVEEVCRMLEGSLDRLVIDETQLMGRYSFSVRGALQTTDEFLRELRLQLGLVLAPDRRDVTMLVVRPT